MIAPEHLPTIAKITEIPFNIYNRYKPGSESNITKKIMRKTISIYWARKELVVELRRTGYFDSVEWGLFNGSFRIFAILKPRKGKPVLEYLTAYKNLAS